MPHRLSALARRSIPAAVAGLSLVVAAGLASAAPAAAASKSHTLTLSKATVPTVGSVITTSSGLTLYRYTVDPAGKATCTGACAKVWPPLLLPKGDQHVKGPKGVSGISTIKVARGRLQVALHHEALYRFSGDTKRGQAKGQGVEKTWFAVLTHPSPSTSPGTGTAGVTSTTAGSTPSTAPAVKPSGTTTSTTSKKAPVSSPTPTTTPKPTPTPTTTPPTTPPTTTPPPTTTTTSPPTGGYGY